MANLSKGEELLKAQMLGTQEEQDNINAGLFALGETVVIELLLEADAQNKKLVFEEDPGNLDAVLYRFE